MATHSYETGSSIVLKEDSRDGSFDPRRILRGARYRAEDDRRVARRKLTCLTNLRRTSILGSKPEFRNFSEKRAGLWRAQQGERNYRGR